MLQPNRTFSVDESYRYGFNGKENDNEVKGEGNQQDYGMRIYDTRLVRFLSVDPLTKKFPYYTPYQFAGNMPIWATDLDGLEPNRTTGNISSNLTFTNQSPSQISPTQFSNIQATLLNNLSTNMNTSGYTYNNGTATVPVSGTFNNTTGKNLPITTGATRSDGSPWTFQVNIIAGTGVSNTNYNTGVMNIYVGNDPNNPNVSSAQHEFSHMLGLDDRYHTVATYNGNNVIPGRVLTPPMMIAPGYDNDYNMNTNVMSNPSANGGGQITQMQFGIIFNVQQEHTEKALIYTSSQPSGVYTTASGRSLSSAISSHVYTRSGIYRVMNDAHGCPELRPAGGATAPLGNYFIDNGQSTPVISNWGSKAQRLWSILPNRSTIVNDLPSNR